MMSKISKVYYGEINPKLFSADDALDLYFYSGFIGSSDSITEKYCKSEEAQMHARSVLLGDLIKRGELPNMPDVSSAIIGVSSLKNTAIIFANY